MADADGTSPTESNPDVQVEVVPDDEKGGGDEVAAAPKMETWGSKMAYFLTLVGYAVGFGNLWRFPYVMRDNGGLAFLVPYCTMLALVGIPMFFLELAVGQRRRTGIVYTWNEICPHFGGIGLCCGSLCFVMALFYNTLLAYCVSYFVDSFVTPLPWSNCDTASGNNKSDDYQNRFEECEEMEGRITKFYWYRRTLDISEGIDHTGGYNWWIVLYLTISWLAIWLILWKGVKIVGKVVWFTALFPYVVLIIFFIINLSDQPEQRWLGAWRLLIPQWTKLYDPIAWLKAGSQIFFSLGLGCGCLVVFASYNPAKNDCHRDAIFISLINCGTSMFGALVVFPIIGLLGYQNYNVCINRLKEIFPNSTFDIDSAYDIYFNTTADDYDKVSSSSPIMIRYGYGELLDGQAARDDDKTETVTTAKRIDDFGFNRLLEGCSIGHEATKSGGGSGFVFIGFTEAVKNMDNGLAQFVACLFFLMFIMLGIDSGFGTVEGCLAAVQDVTKKKRAIITTVVCIIYYVLAILIFPFGSGIYILDIMDTLTTNWTLLIIALAEVIAVTWFYGLAQISYDVHLMTGKKPNMYILICWKYISPIVIILLLIGSLIKYIYDAVKAGGLGYEAFNPEHDEADAGTVAVLYPVAPVLIGFILMFLCIIWLPLHFILRKTRYPLLKSQKSQAFPEDELRGDRNINADNVEDQFSGSEKALMGRRSLQNLQSQRDQKTQSQTSLPKGASSASIR